MTRTQRWLASRIGGRRPGLLVFLGLVLIAAGLYSTLVTGDWFYRLGGAFFIAVGAWDMAIGVAALRERRPGPQSG
jgi:hypothetical protein